MKHSVYFFFAFLISSFCITQCKKQDDIDKLSGGDQEHFLEMQNNYDLAYLYNDSLSIASEDRNKGKYDGDYRLYCDSMYHHYREQWYHHHKLFSHDEKYTDHHHEGGVMHTKKMSRHHEHDYRQSHHQYHHDRMEELDEYHAPYHP